MFKISSKNIEKFRRNSKKGPILVIHILIGPFLLNLCHGYHEVILPSTQGLAALISVALHAL